MTDYILVFMTAPNEDDAANIAREIIGAKLAGCVNILEGVRSIYRWRGKVEDDSEVLMIVKSRKGLFGDLVKKIKGLHSYTVPEIIAIPIVEGSEDYLKWLGEETGAEGNK